MASTLFKIVGRECLLVGATIWMIEATRHYGATAGQVLAIGVLLLILASVMSRAAEH